MGCHLAFSVSCLCEPHITVNGAFGALFGALGGQFQPYYLLNFLGGPMIFSVTVCVRHLNKSTFKRWFHGLQ